MPIEPTLPFRLYALALLACSLPAAAQTDERVPFYVGATLGVTHVSNVYRQAGTPNSDTVVSTGLVGGLDQRFGRQQLTLDGSLQNNRYAESRALDYRSHSLRGAFNWQTVGNLSGTLSARSDRSMADFNIGSGVAPLFKKNIESVDEYQALARLGVTTRYTVEAGWAQRQRRFSAAEYDRFAYRQNTGSLGVYATPAGNVRLGLVGRHTTGHNPRYPTGVAIDPDTLQLRVVSERNDYTRDDLDFTTRWSTGGSSSLDTRVSRSRTRNGLEQLRDFSGTTGSLGWNWQPTAKLQLNLQLARDTGQETLVRTADLNRVYTTWQIGGNYALTSKLYLSGRASSSNARRSGDAGTPVADALDDTRAYNIGLRWAVARGFSLGCQYDHINRDNSVPEYAYTASSYGCTGQAILY